MKLVSLVIINYNGIKYIERCVDSILNQTYRNIELIFIDNQSKDGSYEFMQTKYNKYNHINIIYNKENNGYAGGANQGINLAKGEYIFILNPDIIMNPDFVEKMYKYMESDVMIGALSGKLLKYDFDKNKKLNYIDSAGISINKSFATYDRGQNEYDSGQYDNTEQVFGVCGAAALYRKSALEEIKVNNEYFDEDFFAYKEDVDLSWRLNLIGYKNMYYPTAIVYHGRGLEQPPKGLVNFIRIRRSQSEFLRGISYRNRLMMFFKNSAIRCHNINLIRLIVRESTFFVYSIIFEPSNLKYLVQAIRNREKMLQKRRVLLKKISNRRTI